MKNLMIAITLILFSHSVANAQSPNSYYGGLHGSFYSARPQWNGYYNGNGLVPGYSYNQNNGWNSINYGSGSRFSYRDGYYGPIPHTYNGYRPNTLRGGATVMYPGFGFGY